MANINWENICRQLHISYEATSDSLARGYINIKCPMCGDSDTGHHMGLHKSGRWSCFRDSVGHKGRDPKRIISLISGLDHGSAAELLLGSSTSLEDFEEEASTFMSLDEDKSGPSWNLTFPPEIKKLISPKGRARMYWKYMLGRGFKNSDEVSDVCNRYNIHYCDRGQWGGRIILPVYLDNKLVSWTGRSVYEDAEFRYKHLSNKPEHSPRGLINTKDTLYNYDNATKSGAHMCVLVEGPFDAIKIDFYGYHRGIVSVAGFGNRVGDSQLELLSTLGEQVNEFVICGDENAESNVMDMLAATRDLDTFSIPLPDGVGDPGELTRGQVVTLFS